MEFWLYLYFSLQNISTAICFLAVFVFFLSLMYFLIEYPDLREEYQEIARKISVKIILPIFVSAFILGSIPDYKQMAMIFGLPAVINNEEARKLPNNVLQYMNEFLEDEVKNIKEKTTDE